MISLEEYRTLPVGLDVFRALDDDVYWLVFGTVGEAVDEAVFWEVHQAVDATVEYAVYEAVYRAFERGLQR